MTQRTGYLFIDHRASPGVPEDIAIACGFDPDQVKGGKFFEADTLTCIHCKTAGNNVVVLKRKDRVRPRENCMKCGGKYVCDYCYADMQRPDYVHTPYEKVVDVVMTKGFDPRVSPLPLLTGEQNG